MLTSVQKQFCQDQTLNQPSSGSGRSSRLLSSDHARTDSNGEMDIIHYKQSNKASETQIEGCYSLLALVIPRPIINKHNDICSCPSAGLIFHILFHTPIEPQSNSLPSPWCRLLRSCTCMSDPCTGARRLQSCVRVRSRMGQ